MARVRGVAAASCAVVIAPRLSQSARRASSQSSIKMPCSTGKAQQQYGHVFQPWQLRQGRSEETSAERSKVMVFQDAAGYSMSG